ncbi:MAG: hypothetical protein E6J73_05035 [Deltaproteobacteria bacterium]|nr:MAG: hypothetical protein E6J73_05035 [Deltaproteobacteria bacterium]
MMRIDRTSTINMTHKILVVAVFFVAAVCALADRTGAAQARWEDVVKASEKEGEVTVYATNSVGDLQVIWDAFKKKFPKIKLNSVAISTTSEIVTKIMAERRANQYLVDAMLGAPGATYNSLYRGKALDPMPPALVLPEVTDLSKWWKGKHRYVDPEGQYVFVYQSSLYGPPVYTNTKLVCGRGRTMCRRRCCSCITIHKWDRNSLSGSTAARWTSLTSVIFVKVRTGSRRESTSSACSADCAALRNRDCPWPK